MFGFHLGKTAANQRSTSASCVSGNNSSSLTSNPSSKTKSSLVKCKSPLGKPQGWCLLIQQEQPLSLKSDVKLVTQQPVNQVPYIIHHQGISVKNSQADDSTVYAKVSITLMPEDADTRSVVSTGSLDSYDREYCIAYEQPTNRLLFAPAFDTVGTNFDNADEETEEPPVLLHPVVIPSPNRSRTMTSPMYNNTAKQHFTRPSSLGNVVFRSISGTHFIPLMTEPLVSSRDELEPIQQAVIGMLTLEHENRLRMMSVYKLRTTSRHSYLGVMSSNAILDEYGLNWLVGGLHQPYSIQSMMTKSTRSDPNRKTVQVRLVLLESVRIPILQRMVLPFQVLDASQSTQFRVHNDFSEIEVFELFTQ